MRIILFLLFAVTVAAGGLEFEANRGQAGAEVRYLARTPLGMMFFTDQEVVLKGGKGALRLTLVGANPESRWATEGKRVGETAYFIGRDESKWIRNLPTYERLGRRNVYAGIDAVFYGSEGTLEYDFHVAPYADPAKIRMAVQGARKVSIDGTGGLVIDTAEGVVRQKRPVLYQVLADGGRQSVVGKFRLLGVNEFGFDVGPYDRALALAIDPVIESSTYLGASGDDTIVWSDGSTSVGMTTSTDFPNAAGAGARKGRDILLRGPLLSTVVSTIIIGGSGDEVVTGAARESNQGLVIVGYTDSKDLPTSLTNAGTIAQPEYGGGASDGFVFVLQPSSFQRQYLFSYLGGPGDDRITGVVWPFGTSPTIVGTTTAPWIALPSGMSIFGPLGGIDGFVATVTSGARVFNLAYFGGTGDDRALGIARALDFSFLITGATSSSDFPLVNPLYGQRSGESDAFLLSLQMIFPQPVMTASTLFGGSGADRGTQAAQLFNGNVVLGGVTSSANLPVTNAVQPVYGGGTSDAFLTLFTPDLSRVVSSTFYGGSGFEELTALVTDSQGNLYAGGFTSSPDFPVKNAVQKSFGGGLDDGFLLHFDDASVLQQATYLGGSGSDQLRSLISDSQLGVVAAGQTTSVDFPIVGAGQTSLAGNADGFVTQIGSALISIGSLSSGKDLRAKATVLLGNLNGSRGTSVVVTSSDRTIVLLATALNDAGSTSVTTGNGRDLYVDCLVDKGGADVTLSAPGYPSKVIRANCYPATLNVKFAIGASYEDGIGYRISLPAGPVTFRPQVTALHPASPFDYANVVAVRPGADPIVLQISNSNPQTLGLAVSSMTAGSPTDSRALVLQPIAPGVADLTFTSPRIVSPPPIRIVVDFPPDPIVAVSHAGNILPGPATFTIAVSNRGGAAPLVGPVVIKEILPVGFTLVSMSGTGWTCVAATCTRGDSLAAGSSYATITVQVLVSSNGPSYVVHVVELTASGSVSTSGSEEFAVGGPRATSVTPTATSGGTQTLSFQFEGNSPFDVVNILINDALDGRRACFLAYSASVNALYIVADNGDPNQISGKLMNGNGTVGNSQCTVNLTASSVDGTFPGRLTLTLVIAFAPSFGGNKLIYMAARDTVGGNSGWKLKGTYAVPGQAVTFPNAVSFVPATGSTQAAMLFSTFADSSTAQNLQTGWMLINTALDGRAACYVAYHRPRNLLFLYPDNGDGSQAASIPLSGTQALSNSQCTIFAQGSAVSTNGPQLTLRLNVLFKAGFTGQKGVWTAVQTLGGQVSPWQVLGSWIVP